MPRPLHGFRPLAVLTLLALTAGPVAAFPGIRPAMPRPGAGRPAMHRPNNRQAAPASPFQTAIQDLKAAEKDLADKNNAAADQKTRAAQQIVDQQTKMARAPGGDKDRAGALEAVMKDIREAERQIAARKPDDATTALKAAAAGLEALAGKKK